MSDFWGNNYYNNPPLTVEMIEYAEKSLKVKLPQRFIDLLSIQNGGYTKGFAFPMSEKTTWSETHVPLPELFGIAIPPSIDSSHNILDTEYMTEEWGLPEKQVLLCGDGHWWITLDYRKGDIPAVRWIDCECDEDIHIADSFEDFIDKLVPQSVFDEEEEE